MGQSFLLPTVQRMSQCTCTYPVVRVFAAVPTPIAGHHSIRRRGAGLPRGGRSATRASLSHDIRCVGCDTPSYPETLESDLCTPPLFVLFRHEAIIYTRPIPVACRPQIPVKALNGRSLFGSIYNLAVGLLLALSAAVLAFRSVPATRLGAARPEAAWAFFWGRATALVVLSEGEAFFSSRSLVLGACWVGCGYGGRVQQEALLFESYSPPRLAWQGVKSLREASCRSNARTTGVATVRSPAKPQLAIGE